MSESNIEDSLIAAEINKILQNQNEIGDQCTSPGQLQDVTMDHSYTLGYRSPCLSIPYAGGATSPGQGRSVREFEEQMAALRKENFNLKLRIYFLEETIPGYNASDEDGHESLMKQNIDLKVKVEDLRKELQEKQSIVCEAAKGMVTMEAELKKSQNTIEELIQKNQFYEEVGQENSACGGGCPEESSLNLINLSGDIAVQQRIDELEGLIKQFQEEIEELKVNNQRYEELLDDKSQTVQELETKINQLEFQNAELHEQLDLNANKTIVMEYPKVKADLYEHKKRLADNLCLLDEVETKLKNKTAAHDKACETIHQLIQNTRELQKEVVRIRNVNKLNSVEENAKTQEPTNSGITSDSTALCKTISKDADLSTSNLQLLQMVEQKDYEIENLKIEVKKKTANLQSLVNKELWEKNREIERLTRLLGKNPSSIQCSPIREIDQLQQSFTETEYSQALERNKFLQKKVDNLIQRLCSFSERAIEQPSIQELKLKLNEANEETEKAHRWRKECADVCSVLTSRLEELAGFLDSLLKHKDVLGVLAADRRKAIRKAVDKSLDLSRSLNNMSMSVSGMSMIDHSLIDLSGISGLLDASTANKENQIFNSFAEEQLGTGELIENLKAQVKSLKKELDKRKSGESRKERRSLPMPADNHSESEAWSEPDRNVSLARIGLEEPIVSKTVKNLRIEARNSTTETETDTETNKKLNAKIGDCKVNQLEMLITQRDNEILKAQCELVEADNRIKKENIRLIEITRELEKYKSLNENMIAEMAQCKLEQDYLRKELEEKCTVVSKLSSERNQLTVELRVSELKLEDSVKVLEELKSNHEQNLQALIEKEKHKLDEIEKFVSAKYEEKLKEQERENQEYLARDWVSRLIYEDSLSNFEEAAKKLNEANLTIEFLRETESDLSEQLIENEKSIRALKKSLDDATLQSSKICLERTKALNDKLHIETKMLELTTKLEEIEREKSDLLSRLSSDGILHSNNKAISKSISLTNVPNLQTARFCKQTSSNGSDVSQSGYTSEEIPMGPNLMRCQRTNNTSPDLGIESDAGRTSSVETGHTNTVSAVSKPVTEVNGDCQVPNEIDLQDLSPANKVNVLTHDCAKIDQENAELRRKLVRTKRALEDTCNKLRTANQRKEQVERDIRQQIIKTHKVLKNTRTNIEGQLDKTDVKKE